MIRTNCALLLCTFAVTSGFTAMLRVPSEYATIQAALNAATLRDTVLVDSGVYAEALVMPATPILLRGNVSDDSLSSGRPVIDPSTLPNPESLTCLFMGAGPYTVENFVFRNGPLMFPRQNQTTGGVRTAISGNVFRRCLFDSTYIGLHTQGTDVTLEDCEFRANVFRCVHAVGARVAADDCSFSGQSEWSLVQCGSGSSFERCDFSDNRAGGHLLLVSGSDILIRECLFTDYGPGFYPLYGTMWAAVVVGNLFTNCLNGGYCLSLSHDVCGEVVTVRENSFLNNRGVTDFGQGCNGMAISGSNSGCPRFVAEWNVFDAGHSMGEIKAMSVRHGDTVRYNRFTGMEPESIAVIWGYESGAIVRDNFFQDNGLAAEVDTVSGVFLDAVFNWWGDSTGPYHPTLNPRGHGDVVGDDVLFDPWHSDTSFFPINDVERRAPLPDHFKMLVYPNPFNSVAQIEITPSRAVIIEVELFDLLGRKVRTLWDGPVGIRSRISFNASELSSGVYFIRAWDILGRKSLAMEKVVLLR